MKKLIAYNLTEKDVENIFESMGYQMNYMDRDMGCIYFNVVDLKNERINADKILKDYFIKNFNMKNPIWFGCDGDQPYFEMLVIESEENDEDLVAIK